MFKLVIVSLAFFAVVMTQGPPMPPEMPKSPMTVPPPPSRMVRDAPNIPMPGNGQPQGQGSGNFGFDKIPDGVNPVKWAEKAQEVATEFGKQMTSGRKRRNV